MLRWTLHLKEAPNSGDNNLAAVAVGGDRVYFFGGSTKKEEEEEEVEVHVFSTVSLRWTKILPTVNGKKREERMAEVPWRSGGHTAALVGDIVYIWGRFFFFASSSRFSSKGEQRNALYAFDVSLHRWSKPRASGSPPGGGSRARGGGGRGHSACVRGEAMYVFGGYTNDVHVLDTAAMVWSFIDTTSGGDDGSSPPPAVPASSWHSATVIGTRMFVFGGLGHQEADVRVFDTETDRWLMSPSPSRPLLLLPEERYGHSAFAHNGDLYVFGGIHQGASVNNLWRFGVEDGSWTRVEPRGKVPYQNCWMCCAVVGGGGDRVVLFDDDLYVLDLSPGLRTLCELEVARHGLTVSPVVVADGLIAARRGPRESTPALPGDDDAVGGGATVTVDKRRRSAVGTLTATMIHWMMRFFKPKKKIKITPV